MATAQSTKPLTARTVEVMKPGDNDKPDTGEKRVADQLDLLVGSK